MADRSAGEVTGAGPPAVDPNLDQRRADLVFAGASIGTLLCVALLYWFFQHIIVLLLLSAFVSYAVLPLVDRLDRALPRWAAVLAIAFGGVGLVVAAAFMFAPAVAREVGQLPAVSQEIGTELASFWQGLAERLPGPLQRFVESAAGSALRAASRGAPSPETLSSWAASAAAGITAVASGVLFVPLFVLLMLRNYHRFVGRTAAFVPPRWRARFYQRMHEADLVLSGFVRGQLLVALILALLYGVAFSLVGIPLGLIIGILAGLGELVPFLGGAIALVLGSLMAIAGGRPSDALWVVGIYFGFQGLQSALLSPLIVGHKVRLGPVSVIVALAIGGQLFGMIGLLLAVPAAGLLKVASRAALDAYQTSAFFRRRMA